MRLVGAGPFAVAGPSCDFTFRSRLIPVSLIRFWKLPVEGGSPLAGPHGQFRLNARFLVLPDFTVLDYLPQATRAQDQPQQQQPKQSQSSQAPQPEQKLQKRQQQRRRKAKATASD